MPDYKLHYFPESGNSYKLALMLTLCGQRFEPVWTDFGSGVTFTDEWRRTVNPMGEIPVLSEDGVTLTQTAPILLRLARRFDRFGPKDDTQEFEILRWLFWDNQKLSGHLAAYRYRRAFLEHSNPDVMRYLKSRVDDFLKILEAELRERPFVAGTEPTIADLSMVGYLSFPKHEAGYDLEITHPAIAAWLGRIKSLPGWQGPYDLLPGRRLPCYAPDEP